MDVPQLAEWVIAISIIAIIAFFLLRVVSRLIWRFRYMKIAETYAGYDRRNVAQERLWAKPDYYPTLRRAIIEIRPHRLVVQLSKYLVDLKKVLPRGDYEVVSRLEEAIKFLLDSFKQPDPVYRQIALSRLKFLGDAAMLGTEQSGLTWSGRPGMLIWAQEYEEWVHVTEHLLPYLFAKIGKNS
jgi:hypothetical protein